MLRQKPPIMKRSERLAGLIAGLDCRAECDYCEARLNVAAADSSTTLYFTECRMPDWIQLGDGVQLPRCSESSADLSSEVWGAGQG